MAEAASCEIETKLTQLRLIKSKPETTLSIRSVTRIKGHKDSLDAIVAAVEESKKRICSLMLAR